MGNEIVQRTFVVRAGMTPEDVMNAKNATAQQKKMSAAFDNDGVYGYSKEEAKLFNSTSIADHGEKGVSLWTKNQQGVKKETKVALKDIKTYKYKPEGYKIVNLRPKLTETELKAKYKELGYNVNDLKFHKNGQLKKEEVHRNLSNYWEEKTIVEYAENGDTTNYEKHKERDYSHLTTKRDYNNGKRAKEEYCDYDRISKSSEGSYTLTYDSKGDTLAYVWEGDKAAFCNHPIKRVTKYQNGKGRVEEGGIFNRYAGFCGKVKIWNKTATYNGRVVKNVEDVGFAGRVKVTELDGTVKYYAQDGTQLKTEYATKNPNPSWFERLFGE